MEAISEEIIVNHKLNENGFPEDYVRFITEEEAEKIVHREKDENKRLKAVGVLKAYDKLEFYRKVFFMPQSIQYQHPSDIEREMHEIGFCAALIWSFDKTVEEMMEMMTILQFTFQDALDKDMENIDPDDEVFIDIWDANSDLCKLYGILRLTEVQDVGAIFFDDHEQLENIRMNLASLRDGMVHYFRQLDLIYSWV